MSPEKKQRSPRFPTSAFCFFVAENFVCSYETNARLHCIYARRFFKSKLKTKTIFCEISRKRKCRSMYCSSVYATRPLSEESQVSTLNSCEQLPPMEVARTCVPPYQWRVSHFHMKTRTCTARSLRAKTRTWMRRHRYLLMGEDELPNVRALPSFDGTRVVGSLLTSTSVQGASINY